MEGLASSGGPRSGQGLADPTMAAHMVALLQAAAGYPSDQGARAASPEQQQSQGGVYERDDNDVMSDGELDAEEGARLQAILSGLASAGDNHITLEESSNASGGRRGSGEREHQVADRFFVWLNKRNDKLRVARESQARERAYDPECTFTPVMPSVRVNPHRLQVAGRTVVSCDAEVDVHGCIA
jgi:hypothetical protein